MHTTPANPRSDGLAENHVRTMKDQLSSFVNKFMDDWDEHLPVVAYAYRTTINDATGFTPFYLMHGREVSSPDEEHLQAISGTLSEYVEGLRTALVHTWESTAERVVRNVDTFNRAPTRKLQFKEYEVGDYCMIKRVPARFYKSKKHEEKIKVGKALQMRYTGPYLIVQKKSPVVYLINKHGKTVPTHAVNMKRF